MRAIVFSLACSILAACATGQATPANGVAPTVTVRVENHSRCGVRVKVEQASTLVKSVRVDAQSSSSFGLSEQRPGGPASYTVEPEQRCGVKPYLIGTARFSESATLVLQDDPTLSVFKLDPR
jgi:hypothetical protein